MSTTEFKEWHEYDDNGHLIHYRDSDGHEDWKEEKEWKIYVEKEKSA